MRHLSTTPLEVLCCPCSVQTLLRNHGVVCISRTGSDTARLLDKPGTLLNTYRCGRELLNFVLVAACMTFAHLVCRCCCGVCWFCTLALHRQSGCLPLFCRRNVTVVEEPVPNEIASSRVRAPLYLICGCRRRCSCSSGRRRHRSSSSREFRRREAWRTAIVAGRVPTYGPLAVTGQGCTKCSLLSVPCRCSTC